MTERKWQDAPGKVRAAAAPAETAGRLTDAAARRRFGELMFTLETCRHPLSAAQVDSCESYAAALGSSPEEVRILRVAIDEGVARARPVETGLSDEKRVEILSGVQSEDRLIVGPFRALDELKDGDPVIPVATAAELGTSG